MSENNDKQSLASAFRNARYLYFPFFLPSAEATSASVMNGVLPGTKEWYEHYPETKDDPNERLWARFSRRHGVAKERADLLRKVLGNEALNLVQDGKSYPVSLLRPEIKLSGCVGRSMHGSNIRFLDVVAVYPRSENVMSVDLLGNPNVDEEGRKVFDDFRIHIGDGVTIAPHSVAELCFLTEAMTAAVETCPAELESWARSITKIRHIDCVKVSADGTKTLGVSSHRREMKSGIDHPIENIRGRVISRYEREQYESRLINAKMWDTLSIGARFADYLKPELNWDREFGYLSGHEQELVTAALLGRELSETDLKEADKLMTNHVQMGRFSGFTPPDPNAHAA